MKQTDVVVVGGGIGGLTAAAYLAQAGYRVALFEQHHLLGGCCTSFRRGKFLFDAAVHAIGSCHKGGMLRRILEELDLWERLTFLRADPMDVIMTRDFEVPIWIERSMFLDALRDVFPSEIDRLREMVEIIANFGPEMYGRWGSRTYRELLDHYIKEDGARIVFMAPLGNIGLPSYRIGAINGCTLFRENQLGGGFSPQGGFQALPDALGARIEELGGEVYKRHEVTRLVTKEGQVRSVRVCDPRGHEEEWSCRAVISNAPLHHTLDLIDPESLPADYVAEINKQEVSLSGGILFLGLNRDVGQDLKYRSLYWYIPEVNSASVDACFEPEQIRQEMFEGQGPFYIAFPSLQDKEAAPPGKSTAVAIAPAIYQPPPFWQENKPRLQQAMLQRVEQLLPHVRSHLEWEEAATPQTVVRYTRNTEGAWYGWASIPEQSNLRRLDRLTPLSNLTLAGHWTRPGPGVVQVAKSGQLTARALLRQLRQHP